MKKGLAWIGLLVLLTAVLGGCAQTAQPLTRSSFALNTTVSVTLYDTADTALLDGCMERIAHYERLFSRTIEDSDIARLNAAGGQPVTVDAETAALLQQGVDFGGLTGGAFDITVAPLSDVWNFAAASPQVPSESALYAAICHVSYKQLTVDGTTVRLRDPQGAVDLGGIAKGYIADRLADYLRENGCHSAVINLGGNVYALGQKNGQDWRVGIRDPQDENGVCATVLCHDRSVVTSGVYERGFTLDGVRYHHILDPMTGKPADTGLLSVTIVSPQSVDGDALATACMVLGENKARVLLNQLGGVDALFVRSDGSITQTGGITLA